MLFLHISDIHFKEPGCLSPDSDPSRPYRTRLLQSVTSKVAELGKVDGILIGGDIAFKGDHAEYLAAEQWISELMAICQCETNSVFVVPGNHDVDQRVIKKNVPIQNAQAAIASCTKKNDRQRALQVQLSDPASGQSLFQPLAAYNEFAKIFSCQVYPNGKVSWKQVRPLGGGVDLRIFGLTSTVLSGQGAPNGVRDVKGQMYLGPTQTVFDPIEDTVTMVICHHPPDWVLDEDEVNDRLNDRAHVHLFGHKHAGRIMQTDTYLRIGAGAVNPDDSENDFCPTYNFLDIRIVGEGADRNIQTTTHIMEWQQNPEGYRPRGNGRGDYFFTNIIRFPAKSLVEPPHKNGALAVADTHATSGVTGSDGSAQDAEAEMGKPDTRNLVVRFWKLTSSQRRKVVKTLGVFEPNESTLPEPEQYGRALIRVGEKQMLDELAVQIEKQEQS